MPPRFPSVLKPHPQPPSKIASALDGSDAQTTSKKQHRVLAAHANPGALVEFLRNALVEHHNSSEKRARIARMNRRLKRQGLPPQKLYPTSDTTRKGNLAEIILAEYIAANEEIDVPIYRLRHNPNIDESMKGDDVLAFDLDSDPIRIIIGESKLRGTPRRESVEDIVKGLLRSERAKIPTSLQFVADMLYADNKDDIAERVEELHLQIGRGRAKVDYVGLLVGSITAAHCVTTYTPAIAPRRLAMISLGVGDTDALVSDCFRGL